MQMHHPLLLILLLLPALSYARHVITIPSPTASALAWDPTAQHFLVTTATTISSASDAGVLETLPLTPPPTAATALAVDERRRRLLVAISSPPALAAYDLRSPRPHRRLFISDLPAAPAAVALDPSTGSAFVTAGSQILRVDIDGGAAVFSNSEIYGDLGGIVHVSRGFLLVGERGDGGRIFKVADESGGAKEVLTGGPSAAASVAMRGDGGVVVAGGGPEVRLLKSRDGWAEAAVSDKAAVGEGWRAAAVGVREGRKAYVLVGPADEGKGDSVNSRIEEIAWESEGEGDMVWGMVLIGLGLAYFLYWRFQMGKLVTSINKKNA